MERLADARLLAGSEPVGALIVGDGQRDAESLIRHGADHVCIVPLPSVGQNTLVAAAATVLGPVAPRIVFASGDAFGRECACRLAARARWQLISPALLVRNHGDTLIVAALDPAGKRVRQATVAAGVTALVTLRPGVAEPLPADERRQGTVEVLELPAEPENVVERESLPADPASADIRHVRRLVAGGRGLGGAQGFDLLRRVARKLDAGVAASRVAVDLGWIEYERQVGQTGKTVQPDLYLACGISGASHHLEGMSSSAHIVAINTDPQAPLLAKSDLGLVADLHQVLEHLERRLPP